MNAGHCGASLREAVIYTDHENELYQCTVLSITVATR